MAASATSAAGGALDHDDTSGSPSRPQSDRRLPIVDFLAAVDSKVIASLSSTPTASSEDTTSIPPTSGQMGVSVDDGGEDRWGPARLSVLVAHMHIAGCAPSPELLAASERALAAYLGRAQSPSPVSRRRASSRVESGGGTSAETNAPAWSSSSSPELSPQLEGSREARLILLGLMEMVSLPRGKCGPTATLAATRLMDRLQSLPPDVLLDALPSIGSITGFGFSSDSGTVPLRRGNTNQPSVLLSSSSSTASVEDPLAPFYSTMGISPPPQRRQGVSGLRSDGLSRSPATLPAGGAQPPSAPPPFPLSPRALVSMLEMMAGWGHRPSSPWLAGLVSGAVQRHLKGEAPMEGIHLLALLRVVALLQVCARLFISLLSPEFHAFMRTLSLYDSHLTQCHFSLLLSPQA